MHWLGVIDGRLVRSGVAVLDFAQAIFVQLTTHTRCSINRSLHVSFCDFVSALWCCVGVWVCSIGGRGHSIANGTNDIGIVAMTLVLFKTMNRPGWSWADGRFTVLG